MFFERAAKKAALLIAFVLIFTVFAAPGGFTSEASEKPLAGKKISFLGDSITTYTGWSDAYPITSEEYTTRYGEAYYGPAGGDFHNTELLVTDTWWHQAATELGAQILMTNSGNSTGLLHASYPSNPTWDQYLKDLLAYKSRPHYLGKNNEKPDIIALYIGSSDVAKVKKENFGTMADVDMATLISRNADGSFTHKTPETVAEAYAILLYKIKALYPDAVVYCFTVVPNSGGPLATINKRLEAFPSYIAMIRGVADYFDAHVVDIYDEFGIDPDGDGVATQADVDVFKTYFYGDPHPNAAGFDVITRRFVATVLATYPFETPATGDTVNVTMWAALACVSFIGLCTAFVFVRKKRRAEK